MVMYKMFFLSLTSLLTQKKVYNCTDLSNDPIFEHLKKDQIILQTFSNKYKTSYVQTQR
jgi:hypothetical protein